MTSNLNRRGFLRIAAASSAAVALGGAMSACQPPASAPTAPPAKPTAGGTAAGGAAPTSAAAGAAGTAATPKFPNTAIKGMIIQFGYTTGLVPQLPDLERQTGIKATIEQFGVAEEFQKADIELASGSSAYDFISLNQASFTRAAKAGWIQPLDPFIENAALTNKQALNLEDFHKGAINAFRYEGKLYGLPQITGLQVMYLRKDLLEKAGIKQAPTTYAGLMDAVKELHGKDGVAGIAMRSSRGRSQNVWSQLQTLYAFGAPLVKKFPEDMHPNLDSPEMIEAVTYLSALLGTYSLPNVATVMVDDVVTNLVQGKVAIMIEGAPHAGRVFDPKQSTVADKLDVVQVPAGKAGTFPPVDSHAWVIPSSSRQKDAAWTFANWATSKEVQLKAGIAGPHASPTRISVTSDPAYRQKYSYAEGHWLSTYEKTLGLREDYYGSPTYYLPISEWPELEDRLSVALSEALTKSKTPAQAMKDAQADVTQLLQRAGYFRS